MHLYLDKKKNANIFIKKTQHYGNPVSQYFCE